MKLINFVKANKTLFVIALTIVVILWLRAVFSGQLILSQTLNLGFLQIRYYGIIIAMAVLVGYFFAIRRAPKYGISNNDTDSIIFWILVCTRNHLRQSQAPA